MSFGTKSRSAVGVAVLASIALCAGTAVADTGRPAAGLDGIWQSDGYGTTLVASGNSVRTYQTTDISCLAGPVYRAGAGGTFDDGDGDLVTIRRTGPGSAVLVPDGSVGHWRLVRRAQLPASCRHIPAAAGPRRTFDVFWQTMAENYPFFRAKGMDWPAMRDRYRPTINNRTTDSELYSTLCRMIAPLHDNHVFVMRNNAPPCYRIRPGTTEPGPSLEARVVSLIEKHDLHRRMRTWGQGRIGFSDLPGGRGYLRISGFAGYTKADTYRANRAELTRALNAIFTPARIAAMHGLIIDVRVNGGGDDALGLLVASRLTDQPYLGYAKRTRNDPHNAAHFTVPQPIQVMPTGGPDYTGPVTVLTGGSDVSAGETFVQSLLGRPRTIRIGENTQGVFSDTLDRTLPNGWQFDLPNEEFRTSGGRTFDGTGIPPTIRVPVFTGRDFRTGRDPAFVLATAIP